MRTSPLLLFTVILSVSSFVAQPPERSVDLPGVRSAVTVRRDARDIPYIDASSDPDLYFVQGYVTASDRLWQMDVLRRRARGETAEIFGRAALEDDKIWRRYGFGPIAEENLKYLSPEMRTALDRYAEGVNAYIATLTPETLPIEFKILQYRPTEWRPTDTIVIGKILADALSTTWPQDLQRAAAMASLSPDKFKDITNQITPYDVLLFGKDTEMPVRQKGRSVHRQASPSRMGGLSRVSSSLLTAAEAQMSLREHSLSEIGLYAEDLAASNNWVISGKRTADGKAILANDPHLAPTAPGIWYLAHLSTPGMRVAGVTFPGVPGIVLGHNSNFAWGATNVGPDVQDLYLETFNVEGKYKTPNGWETPVVRKEEIKVRLNPLKTETETVSLDVIETRNGVVNVEADGKRYALKWTARDPKNNDLAAFLSLNRGKNWEDFKAALSQYGGATQNFVYADTRGNIGWYAAGKIPLRRKGTGEVPYDGSTTDGDWIGFIPFAELPNLYNPPSGLIITANQRTVGSSYKYQQFIRDAAMPWRARRIFDRLSPLKKATMDDVRDAQYDIYNLPLAMLAKEILAAGTASAETNALIRDWDGMTKPDSAPAVMVNEIRGCISSKMADANKPVPLNAVRERIVYWAVTKKDPRWLPAGFSSYGELIKSCDEASRASLSDPKRFGPDQSKWRWDNVFRARFMHPLAAAPLIGAQFLVEPRDVRGSGQTPNVGAFVSMRHISSPGNWDATRFVIPLGQSGNPQSPHFRDQFESWKSGAPAVFPFTEQAIISAATSTTIFKPK